MDSEESVGWAVKSLKGCRGHIVDLFVKLCYVKYSAERNNGFSSTPALPLHLGPKRP